MSKEAKVWIMLGVLGGALLVLAVMSRRGAMAPSQTGAPPTPSGEAPSPAVVTPEVEATDVVQPGPVPGPVSPAPPGAETVAGPPSDLPALKPIRDRNEGQEREALMLAARAIVSDETSAKLQALAMALFASENAADRARGAALLAELGALTPDMLDAMATDADFSVPLLLLGSLNDAGDEGLRADLVARLRAQGFDDNRLSAALRSDNIGPAARRALLEELAATAGMEQLSDVLSGAAQDSSLEYDVRLLAATLLATTMDAQSYMVALGGLRAVAAVPPGPKAGETDAEQGNLDRAGSGGQDQGWSRGLDQLLRRSSKPPSMQGAPPSVTAFDIQEYFARPHATVLTDLATQLDYILMLEGALVQSGVTAELENRIAQHEASFPPVSDGEETALHRLRSQMERLKLLEQETGNMVEENAPPF